jgi:PAS domain-containing protein
MSLSLRRTESASATIPPSSVTPLPQRDGFGLPISNDILARLGIRRWSVDLRDERVRWETTDANGHAVVINASLADLLGQAGDEDAAKFRAHVKQAIDTGAAGPDTFSFDDSDHAGSEIESVCVLKRIEGRPSIIGLYRSNDVVRRQARQLRQMTGVLDAFLANMPGCILVLARDGTVLNANTAFLRFKNATERRQVIRHNVEEFSDAFDAKLMAIVKGAVRATEPVGGKHVLPVQGGLMRSVHWRCFSISETERETSPRIFAFEVQRAGGADTLG